MGTSCEVSEEASCQVVVDGSFRPLGVFLKTSNQLIRPLPCMEKLFESQECLKVTDFSAIPHYEWAL